MLKPIRSLLRLRFEGGRFVLAAKSGYTQPAERRYSIVGPDPFRVLLFGGDYAAGFNVSSRRDALDGAIAAVLHDHSGRGVLVENRSAPDVPLHSLVESLGANGAYMFDLVVWCPTFSEAARRPFAHTWRTALDKVVRHVQYTSGAGLVLLTVPALLGDEPLAHLARSHASVLDRAIKRVAGENDRVLAVTPPPIELADVATTDGVATYRAVADALLPALLRLLPAQSVTARLLAGTGSAG